MFFLAVATCSATNLLYAQSSVKPNDTVKKTQIPVAVLKPKGPKAITHEMSAGLRLNSNGWSIYTDIGKVKAKDIKHSDMFYNVRFWQIEFTEKKNPREQKITSDYGGVTGGTGKYIYGKINNFYAVKLGLGFRTLIAGKPDPGTVSIHWVNAFGVSIGLLKPYYLNVYSDPSAIKFADATTQSDFLNQQVIEGKAAFTKGLSEIKVNPGGHFKSAFHFDFSTNRKNVMGVEVGANVEYYSQAIPLMANQTATPYFVDMFVAFQYGRRW